MRSVARTVSAHSGRWVQQILLKPERKSECFHSLVSCRVIHGRMRQRRENNSSYQEGRTVNRLMLRHVFCMISIISAAALAGCGGKESCTFDGQTFCSEGRVYNVDSCGNILEQVEVCQCNCNDDHTACGDCPCKARTCVQMGIECGWAGDGCGGRISCGQCPTGKSCNTQGMCEDVCQSKTCQQKGIECGPADDGCGNSIDCGACPDGRDCTATGRCSTLGVECDPLSQQPCGSGEMCRIDSSGETAVCATAGPLGEGMACQPGECGRGLTCAPVSTGSGPRCYRICDLSAPEDNSGCDVSDSRCFWIVDGNIGLCGLPCDPFSSDCSAGDFCYTSGDKSGFFSNCATIPDEGFAGIWELCDEVNVCQQGNLCVTNLEGETRCYVLCNSNHPCSGESCHALAIDGQQIPGDMGICLNCHPDCSGRECGSDPRCGQSCGTCSGNDTCTEDGHCICEPDCGTQECGLDPVCGTLSCGQCSDSEVCTGEGFCCTPDCGGRQCGSDPICGTSCGDCLADQVCTPDGICCQPDCSGRDCGPDPVCGESCGDCSGNDTCTDDGQCFCEPACGARECGVDPLCGLSCGSCPPSDVCREGLCCTPECAGRECGLDPVCGVSCGACPGDDYCQSGHCHECVQLEDWCDNTSECCQYSGAEVECIYGQCKQCAPYGYECSWAPCCAGLYCNPAEICNTRDCSELGQACFVSSQCCGSTICDSDANDTCQNCRGSYYACTSSSQCCSGLYCDDGMCQ
jgi:hypothetical protein